MFHVEDGGLGEQIALDRFADAFNDAMAARRELKQAVSVEHLAAHNRELVAFAHGLERELKVRDEQLAVAQAALADCQARLADQIAWEAAGHLARLERLKRRDDLQSTGSQQS